MKILHEFDFYSWTVGFAICRNKTTGRLCLMINLLCFALLFMPKGEIEK